MRKSDGSLRCGRALACGLVVLAFLAVAGPAQASRDAYVTNTSGGNVRVIDTGTNAFVGSPITVGANPLSVAITPGADHAYVPNANPPPTDNTVSVIDTGTKTVSATFSSGGDTPVALAISPDGTRAYIANQFDDTVTVFNTANNMLVATIGGGAFCCPSGIALTPDGAHAYVTNQGNDTVSVVDTSSNTVSGTITLAPGSSPNGIAITPDGTRVYVVDLGTGFVDVINTSNNQVVASIGVGNQPLAVAIRPDGQRAYVTNSIDDTVSVINTATNTVVGLPIPLGVNTFPDAVAVRPDGARAYVTNKDGNSVSVIDTATNTVSATIASVGANPYGVAILPNQGPTAVFSATGASAGQPASFDGSGSSDPDGTVADYAWDFGDGTPVVHTASPMTNHTYNAAGHYTATLTVTDNEGCANSLVYTGQTASCNGTAAARIQHPVTVTAVTGLSTTPSGTVAAGGLVRDTATLSGGASPTGTITFRLYGPGDPTCAASPMFTDTASVAGNGDYSSAQVTAAQAGTYRWSVSYSGDANNDPSASTCNETVVVTQASPSLTTSASSGVVLGSESHDAATLAGGASPTGTITFRLFGPDDTSCSGPPVFTDMVTVNSGNGSYPSASFTPATTGTYRWTAAYSGDANNTPASTACNDPNETVVVPAPAVPQQTPSSPGSAPPATPPLIPPLEPPSNAFAFPKVTATGHGANELVFVFDFTDPGQLKSLLTTHKLPAGAARLRPGPHRTAIAQKTVTRDAAGRVVVHLPINKKGRRIHSLRGKLPVRLTLVYTPNGGDPNRSARKLTLPRR
jgi:YVTN family beta-propeller protein